MRRGPRVPLAAADSDLAKLKKAFLAERAELIAIWELMHHLRWLWFIPPTLLTAGWIALVAYAKHLLQQGRYELALKLVPVLAFSSIGRSRLRACVLIDAGRYEEAERILREVIDGVIGVKLKSVARVKACLDLENLGDVLMETGHYEEAQRCFRQASAMNPLHSVWAIGKAEVLLRQGIFPQSALTHADRALDLFQGGAERFISGSRLGEILATKAWALAACGRGAESREAIDAALKSPAKRTKGALAEVHYKAGMSLVALSDHRSADTHFTCGAEVDPAGRWGRLCADSLTRLEQAGDSPLIQR